MITWMNVHGPKMLAYMNLYKLTHPLIYGRLNVP